MPPDPTRTAIRDGIRTALPLAFASVPFGLVYGVAVLDSTISPAVGVAGSWLVLAGAAQLSIVSLVDAGSSWPAVVATALVINARFVLYSAALAPAFGEFPRRWRYGLAYLLTDQAASMGLVGFERHAEQVARSRFFLAAALTFAAGWWTGTIGGVLVGAALPESVDIGFAVPAMFIALLVPTLVGRPMVLGAVVAAVVTVLAAPLPSGSNVIVGAVAGIALAAFVAETPAASRGEAS